MKEMNYTKERRIQLLDSGTYRNFNYIILNLGTHPTAYVEIPKTHKYYKKNYNDCDIDCHGGLTYSSYDYWNIENGKKSNRWFLGWDYAHARDWFSFFSDEDNERYGLKKWTTEEILKEVKNVIKQLEKI